MKPGEKGYKWDEAMKERIRQACLKRNFTKEATEKRINASIKAWGRKVYCIETGKEYITESEAARQLGVSASRISSVCLGKKNTVKGLSFRFVE